MGWYLQTYLLKGKQSLLYLGEHVDEARTSLNRRDTCQTKQRVDKSFVMAKVL